MFSRRFVVLFLAALSAGCGGTSSAPTAPIPSDSAPESYRGLYRADASVTGAQFNLTLRKDPGPQTVTGTFSYIVARPSAPGMTVKAEIRSVERAASVPAAMDFSGTWTGGGKSETRCYSDWGCVDPSFGVALVKQGAGLRRDRADSDARGVPAFAHDGRRGRRLVACTRGHASEGARPPSGHRPEAAPAASDPSVRRDGGRRPPCRGSGQLLERSPRGH